jgi:hypothetical protein
VLSICKTIGVFFTDKNADKNEIIDKKFTNGQFPSMNLSVKFLPTK